MPTVKPRINVVVDDELYARIKAYCAKTGTASASKAVSDLMLVGLKRFEGDTGEFEECDNYGRERITAEHLRLARAMSKLDPYSRKIVCKVLDMEANRPQQSLNHNVEQANKPHKKDEAWAQSNINKEVTSVETENSEAGNN